MKKYLPLSDPEAIYEASHESVVSHIALPTGVDTERLLLNVPRLKRLARWAGAYELHVVTADAGMFEKVDVDVSASSGNAALLTGLPSLPKKDYSHYVYDERDHPLQKTITGNGWPEETWRLKIDQMYKTGQLAIYLNRQAMQEDIQDKDKSLTDAKAWGNELNKSLKRGITQAAAGRYAPERGEFFVFGSSILLKSLAVTDLALGSYYFPVLYGAHGLIRRVLQLRAVTTGQQPASAYNWSAFGVHRIDRLAATAALARSATLVKARS